MKKGIIFFLLGIICLCLTACATTPTTPTNESQAIQTAKNVVAVIDIGMAAGPGVVQGICTFDPAVCVDAQQALVAAQAAQKVLHDALTAVESTNGAPDALSKFSVALNAAVQSVGDINNAIVAAGGKPLFDLNSLQSAVQGISK